MSIHNGSEREARDGGHSKPRMSQSFAGLSHDAIELAELQLKLFKLDSLEAARRTRTSAILVTIGLALLLACLPVALFTGAEALIEFLNWSRTAAFGTAAGVAFALSAVTALAGLRKLKQGLSAWQRSAEELDRNVAWLKSALKGASRSPNQTAEVFTRPK